MFDNILDEYKKNDISKTLLLFKFIFSIVNFFFFCFCITRKQYICFAILIILEWFLITMEKLIIMNIHGINIYYLKNIFNHSDEFKWLENRTNIQNLRRILEKNNITDFKLNRLIDYYKTKIAVKTSFDYVNFLFVIVGFFMGTDVADEIKFQNLLTSFFAITFACSIYFVFIVNIINTYKKFWGNEYYEDLILKNLYDLSLISDNLNN